ncbi:helix-turn-helix transcriptional regulator [Streptococcus parauberis]|uniref:helix-turn-helix domain-containing protein n=1 Tax=Streptococcus parauberis TaxID=1348 RepID=UPI00288F3904|nr:helix-turn-helix transcriptional regulator [Streptococcus parauberis]MDT2749603.1 helix-turn-helix transcriptional regulator [Streptococcus parauberis]
MKSDFAERLINVRKAEGLIQKELGILLDVNREKIAKWEAGINEPSFDMLIVLSRKLHKSTDYFLGLKDS